MRDDPHKTGKYVSPYKLIEEAVESVINQFAQLPVQ